MSDTSTSTARDLTMRISPNGSAAGGHPKQCIVCQARTIAGSMWRGIWHCPKCAEAKAARRAAAKACANQPDALQESRRRCIAEWENVNDPPCHPSDSGWKPCELCKGPA